MVRADANGHATFSYSGVFTGTDKIVATATLASQSPTSNFAQVTWAAGQHTTFLTLNPSPTAALLGQPVTVAASLADRQRDVNPLGDETWLVFFKDPANRCRVESDRFELVEGSGVG